MVPWIDTTIIRYSAYPHPLDHSIWDDLAEEVSGADREVFLHCPGSFQNPVDESRMKWKTWNQDHQTNCRFPGQIALYIFQFIDLILQCCIAQLKHSCFPPSSFWVWITAQPNNFLFTALLVNNIEIDLLVLSNGFHKCSWRWRPELS